MKKALISGITGQDGSFLAEFLLQKGYEVHGILRRSSSFNTGRIEHLYFDEWVRDMKQKRTINLHYGDMTDSSSLIRIIQSVQPDEIYNLAAQSHVKVSLDVPEYTAETDAVGTLRMLEAVRILGMEKKTRIYQASTSELFGKVQEVPQSETYNIPLYILQSTLRMSVSFPANSSFHCRSAALKSKVFCRSEVAVVRLRLRNRYSICFMLFSFFLFSRSQYIGYVTRHRGLFGNTNYHSLFYLVGQR